MKRYKYVLLLLFVIIGNNVAQAQVTVGSKLTPAEGMILELKDSDGSETAIDEVRNTAKKGGLALPKVKLVNGKSLMPFIADTELAAETAEHVGLLVYNVNEDVSLCPGMYVWNGVEWLFLRVSEFSVEFFTDNRDQEIYAYRSFGLAGYWMTENLRAKKYSDNTAITVGIENVNKDVANLSSGMLYTWDTATRGKTNIDDEANVITPSTQGACPEGWHIPSDLEWNQLEEYIANDNFGTFTKKLYAPAPWVAGWATTSAVRGTHGKSLKSTDPMNAIASNGMSRSKTCAGFNGLLVGNVNASAAVENFGRTVNYWSSSSQSAPNAWARMIDSSADGVERGAKGRGNLFAVRCKKD